MLRVPSLFGTVISVSSSSGDNGKKSKLSHAVWFACIEVVVSATV